MYSSPFHPSWVLARGNLGGDLDIQNSLQSQRAKVLEITAHRKAASVDTRNDFSKVDHRARSRGWRAAVLDTEGALAFAAGRDRRHG